MTSQSPLPKVQRTFVLVTAILASGMAFIDGTALNVALPALQRSLNLTGSDLLWVVNAYTLFLAALILIGGSLGDIYGKKRVFITGISIFTIFSICCGLSWDGNSLIIFRGLQGVGGAIMIPGSLSIITASYPEKTRGRAIGTWSMLSAVTTVVGPVLGGYLSGEGLWRFIFFINIPLSVVCLFLLIFKIEEPVAPKQQKPDWLGGLLATIGLGGITLGFVEASEKGFHQWWIWLAIGLGALFFIGFVYHESQTRHPMIPLKLFRSSTFSGTNIMTLLVYGALGALLFFLPLNLIQVQGYPEKLAGVAILPFGITIALLARVSGKWTDKRGARMPLIIGPVITGLGFIGFTFIGFTEGFSQFWSTFFPVLLISGIGMGITVVPLTTTVMNCVSEENSGVASGVNNSVSRFANVLALAILGAIALIQFQNYLPQQLSTLNLTEEQTEYMLTEATNFADASPDSKWSEKLQNSVKQQVNISFIQTFNNIAYSCSGLCFLGALISAIMIEGKPKRIELD